MRFLPILLIGTVALAGAPTMKTQTWENSQPAFQKFARQIEGNFARNLLARKGVRFVKDGGVGAGGVQMLTDGSAGTLGDEGRVNVEGMPAVFVVYLGQPKVITEVAVYTCNIDSRSNQDFEIRVADNSKKPGKVPRFPEEPTFTSGPRILGADRGGVCTRFAADGAPIVQGKVDWIEFRIWRTYGLKAGQPAKTKKATGWTALTELEVLGEKDDLLPPEEIARLAAIRRAPQKPEYEKKATWFATMVAAREAIVAWETEQDLLALSEGVASIGPWRVAGPFPAKSPQAQAVIGLRAVTFPQTPVKKAAPITWTKRDDIPTGQLVDLAPLVKAKPGQVIALCCTLTNELKTDSRHPLSIGLGLGEGRMHVAQLNRTIGGSPGQPAGPNQMTWNLALDPGEYHIVARLPVTADGTCKLWFTPQASTTRPGGGDVRKRVARREALYAQLMKDFPDPVSVTQIGWERADSIWIPFTRHGMARIEKHVADWPSGNPHFLTSQYNGAVPGRLAALEADVAVAPDAVQKQVAPWIAKAKTQAAPTDVEKARAQYCRLASIQECVGVANRLYAIRLAIEDQRETFGADYPRSAQYLARVSALEGKLAATVKATMQRLYGNRDDAVRAAIELCDAIATAQREILLDNPILRGQKLMVGTSLGFSSNWGGPNSLGNEIRVLDPSKPDPETTTLFKLPSGSMSNFDLSWDAKRILYSNGRHLFEVVVGQDQSRQITNQTDTHVRHYDPCYLPNGDIVFVSTACEQAVPCTGGWYVGNLHTIRADGTGERRLTFDQDHDWNPAVLNSGRVLYTRWEYTDTPHYFTRLLFHMNPDGTEQMEYYGSNSYWPNAMYWARPIPGHPTMISCVVSGHHGVSREGELLILDPGKGRHEADGVVQRIPGRGRTVEPVIKDGLVGESWPRFATPLPIAEEKTHRGAGKYFITSMRLTPHSPWGLYLVDVFDNLTPITMSSYSNPMFLRPREKPIVIPSKVDPRAKDAVVHMVNLYDAGNLQGYPKGSIQALRVGTHHYRYGGNGDTQAASYQGGWDIKRILGTVPVHEDGSATFRIPANTPVFVQPLDAAGRAQQTMRWFVGMPGEIVSCVGCHEKQNAVPPNHMAESHRHPPADIKPWHGPTRGFSFDREVQPVLDRRCVGCHDNATSPLGKKAREMAGAIPMPDFRAKRLHAGYSANYSPAYMGLARYVRRAGFEADYHQAIPGEWEATTSHVVQLLLKGHHNVTLPPDEWSRLYTWIDFNVPYAANWRDSHRVPEDEQVARRAKYMKLYAGVHDQAEDDHALPPIAKFEPPTPPAKTPKPEIGEVDWTFDADAARKLQAECGLKQKLAVDLGSGIRMTFVPVPAGKFVMGDTAGFDDEKPARVAEVKTPFYLGQIEVTNAQYAQYDPKHDSAYVDARGKDRFTRGYPINAPDQPVVRTSQHQALAYCRWLSAKSGASCTLPTETEWEWACRAGTATPYHAADTKKAFGNVADSTIAGWNFGRSTPGYNDGAKWTIPAGKYAPNAFGLLDMHGNVAEWTLSTYEPDAKDGDTVHLRVVRGGSWNDTLRFARSASRWRYAAHRPVYNVGFRVLLRPTKLAAK